MTYTGVKVLTVPKETIDQLYKEKKIELPDIEDYTLSQNEYLVLKDASETSTSAMARVKGNSIVLLPNNMVASGVKPKNKEQIFAFDSLLDPEIECVVLTGNAGVGKSLLAIACALELVDKKKYEKIIICKNMIQIGNKNELGFLPGDLAQKYNVFNQGMLCNIQSLMPGSKTRAEDLIEQYNIEFMPLAVIRGSSWGKGTIVISDEVQNLSKFELKTLGTRMGTGSKLILLADYSQIDLKMKTKDCGLYHFVNSQKAKSSSLISSIHLIKVERGELSKLFAEIFEEKEEK